MNRINFDRTDAEKIIYSNYFIVDKYLIACTETIRYRLGKKGKRGRDKIAYMVSCIDMAAKEGEQQGFCKCVGKKKDAMKYHFLQKPAEKDGRSLAQHMNRLK